MISYKEEYFKSFLKEDILKSSSFSELKKKVDEAYLFGPQLEREDKGFIDDAKRTLDILQAIFRKPHLSIKNEEAIIRSGLAPSIDAQSFLKTIEDSSLWKRKNGVMTPTHVHVNLSTDTFVLYENIFICRVLDFIFTELNSLHRTYEKRVGSLENLFETNEVTYSEYGFISKMNQFGYPYNNILDDENKSTYQKTKAVSSLIKKCVLLKTTPFYKEVSMAKAKRKEIIMTNILLKDRRYFLCYKFYKQYLATTSDAELLEHYKDYIFLRMVKDLKNDFIFTPYAHRTKIKYDKNLCFNGRISLYNKLFNYYIEKENDGFKISVKLRKDEKVATYYYLIPILEVNDENLKAVQTLVNDKLEEGFENVIVLTLRNNSRYHHNIVCLSFFQDDDREGALMNIFRSYSLIFKADLSIYEEVCPTCGKKSIRKVKSIFNCGNCLCKYKHISIDEDKYLWLIGLGRV